MVSHYELISVTQGYGLIKFVLDTGKKHQIRLNCCYALNTPIFNDSKYGFERVVDKSIALPDELPDESMIGLHSCRLDVPIMPDSKEMKRFDAEPKKEMK